MPSPAAPRVAAKTTKSPMTVDLSPGQSKCSRQQHDGDAMPGGPAPPSFLIRDILSEPTAHGAAAAAAAAASLAAQGLMHVPFAQHHPLHPLAHHHLPRPPSPADSYSRHSDRDDGHGECWRRSLRPPSLSAGPEEKADICTLVCPSTMSALSLVHPRYLTSWHESRDGRTFETTGSTGSQAWL